MEERKRENLVAGIVGAFLGSLLGAACIILVGQLGYVASVCGLVMAVCTMKGYELLGGCLTRKGAVVSGILILVMTFLAYQMELAIELARLVEVDIFVAFRGLSFLMNSAYIDMAAYWGDLGMLYLFTLLGAVPTVLAGFRSNRTAPTPLAEPHRAAEPQASGGEELSCYGAKYTWVRTACMTFTLPGLFGMLAVLALAMASSSEMISTVPALCAAAAGLIGSIAVEAVGMGKGATIQGTRYAFAKYHGLLWRIDLVRLNMIDTYRFTDRPVQMTAIRWEKLSQEEQERARRAIQRAIQLLCSGETLPGSVLSYVVQCLPDPQLEKERSWGWKISYRLDQPGGAKRKTLEIPKAYPKFAPAPGIEPPTGPAPGNWKFFLLSLAVIAAVMAAGWGIGAGFSHYADGGFVSGGKSPSGPKETVPESTVQYADQGFLFRMDADCTQIADGFYVTQAGDVLYSITVQADCSEEDALNVLLAPIGDYRTDPNFDRFAFAFPGEGEDLLTMTAEDGTAYRYNIMSVYFTDGTALHTAVALAEDGTLVWLESTHGSEADEQDVLGHMLYILRHMERNDGSVPDGTAAM